MVPQLTAVLIVKNEESCLARCLESVRDHVSSIVIVDTGSQDKTVEIAKQYTDKVFSFKWVDDFARARNFALDHVETEFALSIDADEVLVTPPNPENLTGPASNVTLTCNGHSHSFPRILHRSTRWVGRIHEVPDAQATSESGAVIEYGYSEAHKTDPNRNLRILNKIKDPTPRNLYYLGNEYFDRRDFDQAIKAYNRYLKVGSWYPEIADAYLRLARCFWYTQRGDEARENCLKAIGYNPDFKEALLLMSEMTYEPFSHKWKRLADTASNEDVLFVRI